MSDSRRRDRWQHRYDQTRLQPAYPFLATVQKIVGEILPPATGVGFAKEARDLLIECCVEFITLISSEANEISEKEAKKTIACDHITKALEQLGFSDYVPAVVEAAAEHKEVQKVRHPEWHCRQIILTALSRVAKRSKISLQTVGCLWRNWRGCKRNSLLRQGSGTVDDIMFCWVVLGMSIAWR